MIKHPRGDFFADTGLTKHDQDNDAREGITVVTEVAYNARGKGIMMIVGLIERENQKKFGELMARIRKQYSFDIGVISKTLSSAYELIENHREKNKREDHRSRETGRGRGGRGQGYGKRERRDSVIGM